MKTRLFGKIVENVYSVDCKQKLIKDCNGNSKTVYTDKPTVVKTTNVKEWSELCAYEGEPRYNYNGAGWFVANCGGMNISETETVNIEQEIFRADLNEAHLHTDKIVEEVDVDKEETLSTVNEHIKEFNKMMIESNHKLKTYCDLHKLSYEDTDCIELFHLLFPEDAYVIKDGAMKVKNKTVTMTTTTAPINWSCISGNVSSATVVHS